MYTVPELLDSPCTKASKRLYRFIYCFRHTLASLFSPFFHPYRDGSVKGLMEYDHMSILLYVGTFPPRLWPECAPRQMKWRKPVILYYTFIRLYQMQGPPKQSNRQGQNFFSPEVTYFPPTRDSCFHCIPQHSVGCLVLRLFLY